MSQSNISGYRILFVAVVFAVLVSSAIAKTIYVDSINGSDTNPGTKEMPIKTLQQGSAIVNGSQEQGPATIKIAPGIYNITKCVVFNNTRPYTEKNRLIIEALILPDDLAWHPTLMPVVLSTEDPRELDKLDKHTETYSMKIQMSYVTVRGLKFLGNPLANNWHACIERVGKDLDDLLVSQCMFVGDKDALNIYCPVIADGNGLVVEHCIFYKCNASVVFWDGWEGIGGSRCGMRYCIVDGNYISGAWTCQTKEDFEFHHNIITNCEYFWVRKPGDTQKYRIHDCIVTNNRYYSGYGIASGPTGQTGPEVTYDEKNIIKKGKIILVKDKTARNYLHVTKETFGSELGAGLFFEQKEK